MHAGHAEGEVGEEQGVVDDEDVGRWHAALGGLPEAVFVELALLAEAVAVLGADLVPDVRAGMAGRSASEPSVVCLGPVLDRPERFELARRRRRGRLCAGGSVRGGAGRGSCCGPSRARR